MPTTNSKKLHAVHADRAIVAPLVRRAGTSRLRFDVYDVRAELTSADEAMLHFPKEFAKRVEELDGTMVQQVEGALEMLFPPRAAAKSTKATEPQKVRGGSSGARVTKQYVLQNRLHELQCVGPHMLDDLERVVLALAVAELMLGGKPVPTRLVTDICNTVPELIIKSTQQTNVLLGRLASRKEPVVKDVKASGASASTWRVTDRLRPVWLEWVSKTLAHHERALQTAHGSVGAVGASSQADVVARIVRGAVKVSRSTHWPKGHPITAREIAEIVSTARIGQNDPEGLVPLEDALRRQGTDIPTALQAAARTDFGDGTRRRTVLVQRIEHPRLRSPRYVHAEYDAVMAATWADLVGFRVEAKREVRDHLSDQWRAAMRLVNATDEAIRAIGAVRCVALRRTLDTRVATGQGLGPPLAQVSRHHDKEVNQVINSLVDVGKDWPTAVALEDRARDVLRSTSFSLSSILDAPRPTVTGSELAAMLPESLTDGISAAVLAATAITVRRIDVPRAGRTSRVGNGRTESRPLDRVDAVHYAAETAMLPGIIAIQAGMRLIGATHAHVGLVRRALGSTSPEHRTAAMGACVLLGDLDYLARYLLRSAKTLADVVSVLEVTSVVELAWWLDPAVTKEVVTLALRDTRQSVKAAGMCVRR